MKIMLKKQVIYRLTFASLGWVVWRAVLYYIVRHGVSLSAGATQVLFSCELSEKFLFASRVEIVSVIRHIIIIE